MREEKYIHFFQEIYQSVKTEDKFTTFYNSFVFL